MFGGEGFRDHTLRVRAQSLLRQTVRFTCGDDGDATDGIWPHANARFQSGQSGNKSLLQTL